jgi:hypothetical protein
MEVDEVESNSEHFLSFNGTRFDYESGHWIKFEVKRVESSENRPHGIKYSLTLHRSDGARVIGFDNAHSVKSSSGGYKKAVTHYDHWHRTQFDKGVPYQFKNLPQLFEDFFEAVERALENET